MEVHLDHHLCLLSALYPLFFRLIPTNTPCGFQIIPFIDDQVYQSARTAFRVCNSGLLGLVRFLLWWLQCHVSNVFWENVRWFVLRLIISFTFSKDVNRAPKDRKKIGVGTPAFPKEQKTQVCKP